MLYLLILILEVFFLVRIDRDCWGTYFTPFNCLSVPGVGVVILAIFLSNISPDYTPFYLPALKVWIWGLFLFALPSWICSHCISGKAVGYRLKHKHEKQYITNEYTYKCLVVIGLLCLAVAFVRMRSLGSSATWGSEEFSEGYAVGGITAHINVLLSVIFVYMMFVADKRHKMAILICCLSLINMYAIGVKSWIITPCLAGYIARIVAKKNSLNMKAILLIVIGGMVIFSLSYFLLLVNSGATELGENFYTFLINHYFGYLIGPVLSFSVDYHLGILEPSNIEALFAPILNVFRLFSGDELLMTINSTWVNYGMSESNVRSFIGTVYAYTNGGGAFVVVMLLISFYLNSMQLFYSISSNPFVLLANSVNLTFLILGFFDFYWLTLGSYEYVVILLILGFLYKYKFYKLCVRAISV